MCYRVLGISNKQNDRQAVLFVQVRFRFLSVAPGFLFLIDKEIEPVIKNRR